MELQNLAPNNVQRATPLRSTNQRDMDGQGTSVLSEVLHSLVLQARLAIGAHQGVISYLSNGDSQAAIHSHSFSDKYPPEDSHDFLPIGEVAWELVVKQRNAVRMTEQEGLSLPLWKKFHSGSDGQRFEHPPLRGWLAAPILSRSGDVLGVLQLSDKFDDAEFSSGDLKLLIHLAHMVSPTLQREQANQEVVNPSSELRASEAATSAGQMLRLIVDNIPQGVFWKDRQSRYLGCNQVVARAWKLPSPEAIVGLSDYELTGLIREHADHFVAHDRSVMEQDRSEFGIIEQATFADGSTLWLETNKIPMHDAAGTVVGVLGTWQDITARKQAEDELEQRLLEMTVLSRVGEICTASTTEDELLRSVTGVIANELFP